MPTVAPPLTAQAFMVIDGTINSLLIAPNNTAFSASLTAGDNIIYPKGAHGRS